MQEFIVDPRQSTPEELAEGMRQAQTLFKLNHTMPYTDEYNALAKELSVDKGIRHRRVGITGTNYHPLDNEFQIREALRDTCDLINGKENIFEKALLTLVLLSYIQAFSDGNKRTARTTSNAILIANGYCPLSFRSVDSIDYKKAMLIFYEQNNLYAFKQIFMEQFEFAVREYF